MNSTPHNHIPLTQRFKFKLYALTGVAILLLILTESWAILNQKEDMYNGKKGDIQAATAISYGILNHFQKQIEEGHLTPEEARAQAFDTIRMLRFGDDLKNSVNILDAHTGIFLAHANPDLENHNAFEETKDSLTSAQHLQLRLDGMKANHGRFIYEAVLPKPERNNIPTRRITSYYMFEPWNMIVASGIWTDDVDEDFEQEVVNTIFILIGAIAIMIGFAFMINRSLLAQLGGEPKAALGIMEATAEGDFTQQMSHATPGSLLATFGNMSNSIRNMIKQIGIQANYLETNANLIDNAMEKVSEAAETQSKATTSIAAAVQEFTVSVHSISDAAEESEKISQEVAALCRQGDLMTHDASASMQGIETAVQNASDKIASLESRATEISTIASSIREIAEQTNLLALNAAIEAARAGEQGRGFSVVADEVRKLAERTTSATSEIEHMILAVQQETKDSTEMMSKVTPLVKAGSDITIKITTALSEINQKAEMTLSRIQEVSHAAQEQSVASTSISQRVESVAQMVEQTSQVLEDTSTSVDQLRETSSELAKLVRKFKV